MAITAAVLAWLCLVLTLLLVGRHRGANREEARLRRIADDFAAQLSIEHGKVRHLQDRNQHLRDELDLATGRVKPSLVTEWTAFLADITPEDFR